MDYENYIWDLGGTLLDNYESSSLAFESALWELDERVILHQEIYAALKVSTAYAVEQFSSDIPDFLATYKRLEAVTLERPILSDGAREVLSALTENGAKHFMISHRDSQVLSILEAANIKQFFTEVVTADNGFKRKPAPDSVNYLVEKYQMDKAKTVMIGDRALDIEAGNAAGVASIFYDATQANSSATRSIKNLRELL